MQRPYIHPYDYSISSYYLLLLLLPLLFYYCCYCFTTITTIKLLLLDPSPIVPIFLKLSNVIFNFFQKRATWSSSSIFPCPFSSLYIKKLFGFTVEYTLFIFPKYYTSFLTTEKQHVLQVRTLKSFQTSPLSYSSFHKATWKKIIAVPTPRPEK
jgi:hypothetical protein